MLDHIHIKLVYYALEGDYLWRLICVLSQDLTYICLTTTTRFSTGCADIIATNR